MDDQSKESVNWHPRVIAEALSLLTRDMWAAEPGHDEESWAIYTMTPDFDGLSAALKELEPYGVEIEIHRHPKLGQDVLQLAPGYDADGLIAATDAIVQDDAATRERWEEIKETLNGPTSEDWAGIVRAEAALRTLYPDQKWERYAKDGRYSLLIHDDGSHEKQLETIATELHTIGIEPSFKFTVGETVINFAIPDFDNLALQKLEALAEQVPSEEMIASLRQPVLQLRLFSPKTGKTG
jgi:hypothetical protein